MRIEQMFRDDINRKINGVVKVDQDTKDVLRQEIDEYVITRELKKHFMTFFHQYEESFRNPTDDIGVWISGFFGSGKSHFLKMLSYILSNQEIDGQKTVERFREKFEEDPDTFRLIDQCTKSETDTILFNIDIESFSNKDKTAVLRVFAKMFYNYLGYYGEDLKVAKLEQYINKQGKTEDFHEVFERINGESWVEARDAYAFLEDDVVETMKEVLGMSEESAHKWFDSSDEVEISIAQLVSEMKEYVDAKPEGFRLLFMADEVGQYIGESTDLLLNLQSLVEKIGSECNGKVWVICTGQEAIDEIIKARENEFSRIQARFKTRLSLSSSSADEVIQKRILKKNDGAKEKLDEVYQKNESVLRNLFSFKEAILDISGYDGAEEFTQNFPFVPYQFIMMQKVFAQIRKHGNTGKHLSGGERSMLSGFQEAAQKIQDKDEYALAPFYLFYDTVQSFLDGAIRRVIDRCANAAAQDKGLQEQDVEVLKLLYLIRYIDDIPANIDNIVVLMADDLRMDKITMREIVRNSLDRLSGQNYIGRTGDIYNFLTDEEQDIAKEIKNTTVDTASVVERIAHNIFTDIYASKKYRYKKYDFSFDQMVDGMVIGNSTKSMVLRMVTVATDPTEKADLRMMTESIGKAIVVLAETPYFESLENAMKIRKYVKQRNVSQLPESVQRIIRTQQENATKYEAAALENLKVAIEKASFFVDGERVAITSGNAKSKIDQALEYLVVHVYSELDLIQENAESDADILMTLSGGNAEMEGMEANRNAATKVDEYLEMQARKNLPTSMADIQSRYQTIPYGWREIDIANVVALLIYNQKVTIKYGGETIQPNNPKLPDLLRKKSEIGKTSISKRRAVSAVKMRDVKGFLREYFDVMDVPEDEDGLIGFIKTKFSEQRDHYEALLSRYHNHKYPDHGTVEISLKATKDVLSNQKDNLALIEGILKKEDKLFDLKEDMQNIESFFASQVNLFDAAIGFTNDLRNDLHYFAESKEGEEANQALNQIRRITMVTPGKDYDYREIPRLNELMTTVQGIHETMLEEKREELFDIVAQCQRIIRGASKDDPKAKLYIEKADHYYGEKTQQIKETTCIAILEGYSGTLWEFKDKTCNQIELAIKPPEIPKEKSDSNTNVNNEPIKPKEAPKKEVIKPLARQAIFPARTLKSEYEIDAYLEQVKKQMKLYLQGKDGIVIK